MSFDWKSVVSEVAPVLTAAAGAVSGPFAPLTVAAMSALSTTILGHPNGTEADINAAIQNAGLTPDARVKLAQQEEDFKAHIAQIQADSDKADSEVEADELKSVNATIREELKGAATETWGQKTWRPFNGFILGVGTIIALLSISFLVYEALVLNNATAMGMIPAVAAAFIGILAVPGAAVGVASWHRGVMKRIQAGEVLQK